METLNSIQTWDIDKIYIDGELEYGEGGYDKDDFLRWLDEKGDFLFENRIYLFGFTRNILCEVIKITTEPCERRPGYGQFMNSVYLRKIADLDDQPIEIKQVRVNSYLLEVKDE